MNHPLSVWILASVIFASLAGPATSSPRACSDPAASEAKLKAMEIQPTTNPIVVDPRLVEQIIEFVSEGEYDGWCHDVFPRTNDIRLTGPFVGGRGITTHARVRVFYSEQMVAWLDNNRSGVIPDGAMMVKEMHPLPEDIAKNAKQAKGTPAGWAVMVRDSNASKDGWLWLLFYAKENQTTGVTYSSAQYGLSFCVSCHASADTDQQTFAFLGNLENDDVATYSATSPIFVDREAVDEAAASNSSAHGRMRELGASSATSVLRQLLYKPVISPKLSANIELLRLFQSGITSPLPRVPVGKVVPLPPDAIVDHVVQPSSEPDLFVTGDACVGCHDASSLLNSIDPNMTIAADPKIPAAPPHLIPSQTEYGLLNLSPYGEWSSSLMHLSSRDPVFRAQFEYEIASLEGKPKEIAEVSELCMSCHGVMGQRRFSKIAQDPAAFYAFPGGPGVEPGAAGIAATQFGALARDGVSCAVCHHVSPQGLGTEETFTAKFKTGPANELYGPYEEVKTHPMEMALGVNPTHGAQIKDAGLCGSCHSVEVPIFDEQRNLKGHRYEQTTYMEWLNSKFGKPGSKSFETCQQCHMRNNEPGTETPFATRIANIEDSTFPYVPNRSSSDLLELTPRTEYGRHTLTGINVSVLSMFEQFPGLLGANTFSPNRAFDVAPSQILTMREALDQAKNRTAQVEIRDFSKSKGKLEMEIEVTNLAGHKLPSGVGFRRAILEVSVRDAAGGVVWCSGCTDGVGVVIDSEGERLPSELTKNPAEMQPDYVTITKQNQVQIYEDRHADCEGILTTSFIRLCEQVKDNRILPDGWRSKGPFADETTPVGIQGKTYTGRDLIRYEIDLASLPTGGAVHAALHYQSIPPYYLVDRFSLLGGAASSPPATSTPDPSPSKFPETERLLYMALHLDVDDPRTDSKDWKIELARTSKWIED